MKYLLLPLALLCGSAFAQQGMPERATEFAAKAQTEVATRFAKSDANGDGKLTRAEAQGNMPRVYQNFDAIDKEGRGFVTIDQIKAFAAEQIAERRQQKGS